MRILQIYVLNMGPFERIAANNRYRLHIHLEFAVCLVMCRFHNRPTFSPPPFLPLLTFMGVNLDIEPHIKVIEGGIQLRIMTEENGSNGTILFEKVTLNSLLFSGEEWNLLTLPLYSLGLILARSPSFFCFCNIYHKEGVMTFGWQFSSIQVIVFLIILIRPRVTVKNKEKKWSS